MNLWIVVTKFDALNQSIMLSNAMKSKQHVENMYNPNHSILDGMGILKLRIGLGWMRCLRKIVRSCMGADAYLVLEGQGSWCNTIA